MIKRIIAGIIVLAAIAVVAGVGLLFLPRATTSTEQLPERRTTDVKVMRVKPAPLAELIMLPATVEPFMTNEISAEVDGRIDWIGPEEGDEITEIGTPLLRIDQRTFRAQLDEAEAAHDLSVKKCRRAEELHAGGVFSDEQLDQCQTQVATDAARLELARIQLEKATIRSPIAGVLNRLYFDVGEYVRAGDRVVDIVVIDPVKVLVKAPEKDISYVSLRENVRILFSFSGEEEFGGTVSYVSVVGDSASRTYDVEITLPNPDRRILPAMIGEAVILKREIPDAITVPLVCVLPRGDFSVVFVEDGDRARERIVEMGILDGNRIQIVNGIEPNDRVIIEGQRKLADGDFIEVKSVVEAP